MLLPFSESGNYTHADLVALARDWLKNRCAVVVSEITTTPGEEPDALGWQGSDSILIECKASRADFLADKNKVFRRNLETGLGDYRYYLAPVGVIKDDSELPDSFGWLEINPMTGKIRPRRHAEYQKAKNITRETRILISCIRRIGQTEPEGIAIKCYTVQNKCRAAVQINLETEVARVNTASDVPLPPLIQVETKVRKQVNCSRRLPNHRLCNQFLYQTDGEFLYDASGSIINPGKGQQKIQCCRCGRITSWYRKIKDVPD